MILPSNSFIGDRTTTLTVPSVILQSHSSIDDLTTPLTVPMLDTICGVGMRRKCQARMRCEGQGEALAQGLHGDLTISQFHW